MGLTTRETGLATPNMESLDPPEIVRQVLSEPSFGRVGVVSSFGAESAVLLHLVATVDKDTPVLFVDTGKLFGETHRYAETLVSELGLADLRVIRSKATDLAALDPRGDLWREDAGACCEVRKVAPLQLALDDFDTWITGRKRFQSETRTALPIEERLDGRLKVNPLASWSKVQIDAYFEEHNLPRHPLEADGFLSIGCFTCTDRVQPGEDARAGRWRGSDKTECGIHLRSGGASSRLPSN